MNKTSIKNRILLILLAATAVLLTACSGSSETPAVESEETAVPAALSATEVLPTDTAVPPTAEPEPTAVEAMVDPIDDEEAVTLMNNISRGNPSEVKAALERIESANDQRFIAVLIDAYRGWQLRLLTTANAAPIVESLENLSGQSFGQDWPAWIEWYGNTELEATARLHKLERTHVNSHRPPLWRLSRRRTPQQSTPGRDSMGRSSR